MKRMLNAPDSKREPLAKFEVFVFCFGLLRSMCALVRRKMGVEMKKAEQVIIRVQVKALVSNHGTLSNAPAVLEKYCTWPRGSFRNSRVSFHGLDVP
jgi:hypothetical protein